MVPLEKSHQALLRFWFPPNGMLQSAVFQKNWFTKNADFDDQCRKFVPLLDSVLLNPEQDFRAEWRSHGVEGYLAEILLLDQIPRNTFRDTPKAFAFDVYAQQVAKEAISKHLDKELLASGEDGKPNHALSFLYMPLMHSEDRADHELSVQLFAQPG